MDQQKLDEFHDLPAESLDNQPNINLQLNSLTRGEQPKTDAPIILQEPPPIQAREPELVKQEPPPSQNPTHYSICSICTVDFYRKTFGVSTYEILLRLLHAICPYLGTFYETIKNKPDLYGPLWIYMTIVYLFTFVPNCARYFAAPEKYGDFDFSFFLISFAGVFGVGLLFPVIFAIMMKCCSAVEINTVEVFTIYGYSFTIYIPVIILCSIPSNVFFCLYLLKKDIALDINNLRRNFVINFSVNFVS